MMQCNDLKICSYVLMLHENYMFRKVKMLQEIDFNKSCVNIKMDTNG